MAQTSSPLEPVGRALLDPSRGVVGLVDELLAAGRERELRLTWAAGRCRAEWNGSGEAAEVSMPLAVGRAVLARLAALCNEGRPGSVSPHGGRGQVAGVGVAFVNTAGEQSLELVPLAVRAAGPVTATC